MHTRTMVPLAFAHSHVEDSETVSSTIKYLSSILLALSFLSSFNRRHKDQGAKRRGQSKILVMINVYNC